MFLKCNYRGNAYGCPPRNVGDRCGVNKCSGVLVVHKGMAARMVVVLKYKICGNVYSDPPKKEFDHCGVGGCRGTLRRV